MYFWEQFQCKYASLWVWECVTPGNLSPNCNKLLSTRLYKFDPAPETEVCWTRFPSSLMKTVAQKALVFAETRTTTICNSSFKESDTLSWPLLAPAHMWHTYTRAHIHENIFKDGFTLLKSTNELIMSLLTSITLRKPMHDVHVYFFFILLSEAIF